MASRTRRKKKDAIVGVADHCGWAVLVTVAGNALVDRRRVELVDDDLPSLPHHSQGQQLPLAEAVELVDRVRASADAHATASLEALDRESATRIVGMALRAIPRLPDTVAERITGYHAQTRADGVMYREALARAAESKGWFVCWYETKSVFAEATKALDRGSIDELLDEVGRTLGPPWRKDHRVAMAAAIAAASLSV